jgi:acid phosphatase (class A)
MKEKIILFIIVFLSWLPGTVFPDSCIYITEETVPLVKLLPSPPKHLSDEEKKEILEILKYQRTRSSAMILSAVADQDISVFCFTAVIGDQFNEKKLPLTAAFFQRIIDNEKCLILPVKEFWKRERPFAIDERIIPCIRIPRNLSYPSEHAVAGHLMAIVLARMIPENEEAIIRRGQEFAENRIIGGVHFRSDIEAGKQAAGFIAAELFKNDVFIKDFLRAKMEVREVLGY